VWGIFERQILADRAELQRDMIVEHLRTLVETSERITRIKTDTLS
jgi:hypothetical protein